MLYDGRVNAIKTARQRAREELTAEIKDCARRHLAEHGAAGLSLRAVARELGMVSSAVYRYFASRDELLTALIIDAFNAIGEAVEAADGSAAREDYPGRWLAAARAVREWARTHPHEYALVHGTPVPGYAAPRETSVAAARDGIVLAGILRDAAAAGVLAPPDELPDAPASFAADADLLRQGIFGDLPDDAVLRAIMAWTYLYGAVSFELFGMYNNVLSAPGEVYDAAALTMARLVGLPVTA